MGPLRSIRLSAFARLVILAALVPLAGCSSTADPVRTGNPRIDLKSSDPVVVQMATRLVVALDDIESMPILISNLRHENRSIRLQSHAALRQLAKLEADQNPFGYSWLLENPAREKAVRGWEEWYATEGRDAIDHEIEQRVQDEMGKASSPAEANSTNPR